MKLLTKQKITKKVTKISSGAKMGFYICALNIFNKIMCPYADKDFK